MGNCLSDLYQEMGEDFIDTIPMGMALPDVQIVRRTCIRKVAFNEYGTSPRFLSRSQSFTVL